MTHDFFSLITLFKGIQIIAIFLPLISIIVLTTKDQGRSVMFLILAAVASMITNAAYLLMLQIREPGAAAMLGKLEYMTIQVFIFFFVLFVVFFLQIKVPNILFNIWALIIFGETFCNWSIFIAPKLNANMVTEYFEKGMVYRYNIQEGLFSKISGGQTAIVLLGTIVVTAYRFYQSDTASERRTFIKLGLSELLVFVASSVSLSFNISFDIMPACCAFAVFLISSSVRRGDYISVNDMGAVWAVNNMQQCFAIVSPTYRLLYVNPYAKTNFELFKNNKLNKHVDDELKKLFTGEVSDFQIGDTFYQCVVTDIHNEGRYIGKSLILVDTSEIHMLMNKLDIERQRAQEAMESRTNFLSTMSHEIRTPMNAIVGMTDILLRKPRDDEDRGYMMNIKNSGTALLAIINDILDFNKIDAGKMELVCDEYDPMSMFNDIRMILLNRIGDKPVELIFDIDKRLPAKLYGDNLRIRQIILNLGNNAIKFTESGSVTLAMEVVNRVEDDIELRFIVKDTGIGIKEADLGKLFGAFSQVDTAKNHNKEGTGLGLAICKNLVELMNGNITVSSEYEHGSEFSFTIHQEARSNEFAGSIDDVYKIVKNVDYANFRAEKARVLLVDDNEMNLKVAIGLLEPIGMQIDTALNGKEAVERVKTGQYDLILMDHMMPVMDGVEATKIIRGMDSDYYKNVPILALSANVVREARDEFKACGMNDFIAKPIELKDICKKLRQYLPDDYIIEKVIDDIAENSDMSKEESLLKQYESEFQAVGIDIATGLKYTGTYALLIQAMIDYYNVIDMKSLKINKLLSDDLIRDYTIEVHALKSASRTIGASSLSEEFKELEELGNNNSVDLIKDKTYGVLSRYESLKAVLANLVSDNTDKQEVPTQEIIDTINNIKSGIDSFDLDSVDANFKKLEGIALPTELTDSINKLRAYVADVAMEDIITVCDEILTMI